MGFFGDLGNMFSSGTGLSGFKTDPNAYNLPQLQQQQDFTHGNSQAAMGGQAPTLDQSQSNQFRGQQQHLAQLLMAQSQGMGGPSVAQQQLNQTTQGNVANAYAMAQANPNDAGGLRSLASNVGNLNQQAAQQAALLRAQETLGAQGLAGQVSQGARTQDLGAANDQAQLLQNQFQLDNQAALGWNSQNQDVNKSQQQGQIAQQQLSNSAYQNQANHAQSTTGGIIGGIGNAIGLGSLSLAHGGMVPGYASGGPVGLGYFGVQQPDAVQTSTAPLFTFSKKKSGSGAPPGYSPDAMGSTSALGGTSGMADAMGGAGEGAAAGGMGDLAMLAAAVGGKVPGHASDSGDSSDNDTVPAMLSPGEVVLPRSVSQSDDAPDKARAFMEAVEKSKAPKPSFKDVLESHRQLHQRLAQLESRMGGAK